VEGLREKCARNERRVTMGLMNMENHLENMLNSMREELGEDTEKKEKQPQKEAKENVDLDELLKSIPDLMTKEKKKQSAVSEKKSMEQKIAEKRAMEKKAMEKKALEKKAVEKKTVEEAHKIREPEQQLSVEDMFDIEKLKEKKKEKTKPKKHILIVDDDIRVLKMMKEVLKNDYDTAVASNGDIAMKFLDKHGTDLILLDYMMPGENGKEVLERIRQNPKYYNIPVFFLTGMSDADKVQECLALRPQGYMLKPVKQFELLRRVKEILE
jgi:CheY-like chemotaxis protein